MHLNRLGSVPHMGAIESLMAWKKNSGDVEVTLLFLDLGHGKGVLR